MSAVGVRPVVHGITEPISEALPTKYEEDLTTRLIAAMQPFGVYESEPEMNRRYVGMEIAYLLAVFSF